MRLTTRLIVLMGLVLSAAAGANTIPTDDVRCESWEITLGVELAADGHSLIATRALGLTPEPWDSQTRPDVARYGLGGIFWLGQGNPSRADRYLVDVIACPEPGVSGFPPMDCPHAFYEARAFVDDGVGWLYRLEPWAAPGVEIPLQTSAWDGERGFVTLPLCGIPQYGLSTVTP